MLHIPQIAIDGGPCGGKSTGMIYLVNKLIGLGYLPFVVPEAATLLILGGATPVGGVVPLRKFQTLVIRTMIHLEAMFEEAARASGHPKPILVCDRGLMGTRAYMTEEMFEDVMRELGLDRRTMRDERYDGVFLMRTAALGAEAFYTQKNNAARFEDTLEKAIDAEDRTERAWLGHPHLSIIGNEGRTFDEKLECLFRKVCLLLGEPEPLEIERKYLVDPVDLVAFGVPHAEIAIEQSYLHPHVDGHTLRIRKRGQFGSFTYFETKKSDVRPGVRREIERFITEEDYNALLPSILPGTVTLEKRRLCFVWKDQHFELDIFESPHCRGVHILEIELLDENDPVAIPSFIRVQKEVTDDPAFSSFTLAKVV